jgi:hypothetical protein
MSLEELTEDVESTYDDLGEELSLSLDRETRNELATLAAILDTDDPEELVRRGVHLLFQTTVDTGQLDFQLRRSYDVTYDEYLAGMTYEDMTTGNIEFPTGSSEDARRYQF